MIRIIIVIAGRISPKIHFFEIVFTKLLNWRFYIQNQYSNNSIIIS